MKSLGKVLSDIFLDTRFIYISLLLVFTFILGFAFPVFLGIGKILFIVFLALFLVDLVLLFSKRSPISGRREMESKLSNGDYNPICLTLDGSYPFQTDIKVIEEYPEQLQLRTKTVSLSKRPPNFHEVVRYEIRPTERGEYEFGDSRIIVKTIIGIVQRRVTIPLKETVKVYPSFIQYRKYAFLAINNRLEEIGVKKIRQLGVSNEFEQIREYVRGDDFRLVNWSATARRNELMVNQYQEEKAQNIYCVIDKGRLMHMPFDGLSLLDYAINASLVLSGVAIGKDDKAGLITYSDKIGSFIMAEGKRTHMSVIADALYNQDVRLRESDFFRLYRNVIVRIKKRSLMVLFTNFDSIINLSRQIKYLSALAKRHLLCVVIFDNTEINNLVEKKVYSLENAYHQTIAEKFQHDKRLIIKELKKHGIFTILTEPQDLTVNTINRYIQFKAMGMI